VEPYQQRVVDEKRELDEKLQRLNAFLQGRAFAGVSNHDRDLLPKQAVVMQTYSNILEQRIASFASVASSVAPSPDGSLVLDANEATSLASLLDWFELLLIGGARVGLLADTKAFQVATIRRLRKSLNRDSAACTSLDEARQTRIVLDGGPLHGLTFEIKGRPGTIRFGSDPRPAKSGIWTPCAYSDSMKDSSAGALYQHATPFLTCDVSEIPEPVLVE